MSEVWVVHCEYGPQDTADVEGVFSSEAKAKFYLEYIRDKDSRAMITTTALVVDELVKDVREVEK